MLNFKIEKHELKKNQSNWEKPSRLELISKTSNLKNPRSRLNQ
jgi:hypothetical protein